MPESGQVLEVGEREEQREDAPAVCRGYVFRESVLDGGAGGEGVEGAGAGEDGADCW